MSDRGSESSGGVDDGEYEDDSQFDEDIEIRDDEGEEVDDDDSMRITNRDATDKLSIEPSK